MRFKALPKFTGDVKAWAQGLLQVLSQADLGTSPGVIAVAKADKIPEGWETLVDPLLPTLDAKFTWVVKR